ncbi:MAG TPA: SPOR domain-containing protein [Geobacteraceae bacterium]
MVKDYSGRRQVTKNRPRKQPVGIFAVILFSAVTMSFALGVLTGWLVFKPARKAGQGQLVAAAGAKGQVSSVPQAQYPNPEANAPKGVDPPLTFYETLPKGGKAIIGSGLNPAMKESPQPKTAPVSPQPPAQPPRTPPAAPKAGEAGAPAEQAGKAPSDGHAAAPVQNGAPGKYCVQVASTQERKEAEALQARLAGRGLPAFIVESTIRERGTWFRVRIGKHLSRQAAEELVEKAGKGAMVIAE